MSTDETPLTYQDISDRTGITVNALRKRKHLGTMPPPDLSLGGTPVWFPTPEFTEWMRTAGHSVRGPRRNRKGNK